MKQTTILTETQKTEIRAALAGVDFNELKNWAQQGSSDKTDKQKVTRYASYIKGGAMDIKTSSIQILNGINPETGQLMTTPSLNVDVFKKFVVDVTAKLITCNSLAHEIVNPSIKQDSLKKQIEDHFIDHCPEEGALICESFIPKNNR